MSTSTQVCEVVLPGYALADRIGSGGYAEVWRAEAPGGIQKAIKLVHGYYDDEFASQELKALERVKGVRHPFLLSLERFEVINGRLVILTELADMSLEQRLRECRADGLTGIPRDELLRYMADAAEAIDFLSQRHQLLHLDIKPENLLILGDHIKVADFGLVKELATRTQNSLVSGMTPTYASPEMFDDNPSIHSDQYSLAIVYQEMLVGTLPFPGRTAAQLAKQHTQLEPQLSSLPTEDRPIVARALAKTPEDRYPSCRAFVEALVRCSDAPAEQAPAPVPRTVPRSPTPAKASPDDTKSASICTTLRRTPDASQDQPEVTVTQPVHRKPKAAESLQSPEDAAPPETLLPEETNEVELPEIDSLLDREQPTLYVAMGGVGIQTLCRLRALLAPSKQSEAANGVIQAVALDTDRDELREACTDRWKSPMDSADIVHLPLKLPQNYDNSREILGWLSRRWLYNIPRSLETRGYRPLGRVALVDNSQRVLALLEQKLLLLADLAGSSDHAGQQRDPTIKVVLLSGTGGGTGSGMVLDVANAVKSLAAVRNLQVDVTGVLICTCFVGNNSSQLAAANTYSLLIELNHATASGNQASAEQVAQNTPFESANAPFDCVYCIPLRSGKSTVTEGLDAVAEYLALETTPGARSALRACRISQTPREQARNGRLNLRKVGHASLADQKWEVVERLAGDLAEEVKQYWLTTDRSADWEQLVREDGRALSPKSGGKKALLKEKPDAPDHVTPLALRGRFHEFMSLEFTSDVLRQIQDRLEARDERGRPHISAYDARLIADSARMAIASLAESGTQQSSGPRFSDSDKLRPLIPEVSGRALRRAVEEFDIRHPENFLPTGHVLQAQCQAMLEAALSQPELSIALTAMLDLDEAVSRTLDRATSDLVQCGSDRRTLVLVPQLQERAAAVDKLRAIRPLAAVVATQVEDILVVTEDSGISSRSLAMGLERVFPGVADAARRLLTRIDIEWTSLL